jgi:hypothetical protein
MPSMMAPGMVEPKGGLMADEERWLRDKAHFTTLTEEPDPERPDGPLAEQFADLTRRLLDVTTTAEALTRVVDAAHRVIPDADLVSVTLRSPDGAFHTPIETAPPATELDQLQYRTGEGPCVDAARLDSPGHVGSDDLAHEPKWPEFAPAAAGFGFTGVLSTVLAPAPSATRLSGALNVYSRRSGALDTGARDTALLLATHAALALAGTEAVTRAELERAHLRRALESRDVIGQAKGILMHRRGLTADEAFDLLRRTSQDLNVKLAELARTLAARHAELDLP